MKKVYITLKQKDPYPYKEVQKGIQKTGAAALMTYPSSDDVIDRDTYIVTWNNYGIPSTRANMVRAHGGYHIVMENGFLNDAKGNKTYVLNFGSHLPNIVPTNMSAGVKQLAFDLTLKPFKKGGDYILVCGQRGGKYNSLAMPNTWPDEIVGNIRSLSKQPIVFKPHPDRLNRVPQFEHSGLTIDTQSSLDALLANASVCVVYTSNAATHAIRQGVPVIYQGPDLLCKHLASCFLGQVDRPFIPTERERDVVFSRMCDYLWTREELQTKEPWAQMAWRVLRSSL